MTIKEGQEAVDKCISTYGIRYFNELTNQTGIDLEKSFQQNLLKKTARDFERHQQNDKLRNPRPQL